MHSYLNRTVLLLGIALGLAACGSDEEEAVVVSMTGTPTLSATPTAVATATPVDLSSLGVDASTQERCDPLGAQCMLPIPNDHFTVADDSAPTKRRLALVRESLPANIAG